jgi:hypothetical protein
VDDSVREGRCPICGELFWVCRPCDHGQVYCPKAACQQQGRKLVCRRARANYRADPDVREYERDYMREYMACRRAAASTRNQALLRDLTSQEVAPVAELCVLAPASTSTDGVSAGADGSKADADSRCDDERERCGGGPAGARGQETDGVHASTRGCEEAGQLAASFGEGGDESEQERGGGPVLGLGAEPCGDALASVGEVGGAGSVDVAGWGERTRRAEHAMGGIGGGPGAAHGGSGVLRCSFCGRVAGKVRQQFARRMWERQGRAPVRHRRRC